MPTLLQLSQSYQNPESVNYRLAYLREQTSKNLGYSSFEEQVQLATLGKTVIVGGYLNTELIKAKSIVADQLNVDDLSAITGKFTFLMAGDPFGARLELGESAGSPFLEAYDSENDLRVKLLQDSLEFSAGGITGGKLEAEYFGAGVEGEDRAGLLLSSTYSIKMQAFYYAWMETYGAAVQCAGEIVQAWADRVIGLNAPEINIYGDIKLNGNKLQNFAYASDATRRETSMSTYTDDYNLLLEISVKAGEYYMVQLEGVFWASAGTQMNAYVDVIGSATRVSGSAYLGTRATALMDFTGSTMSIWRADADGKLSFIMRWRAVGGGTAYCQYRSMKAWRVK